MPLLSTCCVLGAIMQTSQSMVSKQRTRSFAVCSVFLTTVASLLLGQNAVHPTARPTPAKIEPHFILIVESVVQDQWTHTLKLVNAPQSATLLNPGQCIRVGIYATGDNRDSYLENTKLSFRVLLAGQDQDHPLAPLTQIKQIKPEGGDFVTAALAAGGIKNPLLTMATLGASAENWCVPSNAGDGTATVEAEAESPSGHQILESATVEVESFETGSKKQFKDANEFFSDFLQTYYRHPNPARLLPALQFLIAQMTEHPHPGVAEDVAAFLSAALKADPVAAKDFLARIAVQPPLTRSFGLLVLRSAGYDISNVLNTFSTQERQKFLSLPPLADPFDLTPTQALFGHLDLMWSTFGATGDFEPVRTIASTLSWRADYDDFEKLRTSSNHPTTLTPSIVRGVTYTAAGWSLSTFQRNDPLVADYIDYMLASPDFSPAIKSELSGLSSNPAFKRANGK